MKKVICIVCLLTLCVGILFGCVPKSDEDVIDGTVKITETQDSVTLENGRLSMSFVKENGSMYSFKNNVTKTDFIEGSTGGNWALFLDTTTDNAFQSNPTGNGTIVITSRKQKAEVTKQETENGISLVFSYDVNVDGNDKSGKIIVKQTVTLNNGQSDATISYELENQTKNTVITTFVGAQLSGIKNEKGDYNLFWPYKEGKIYQEAVKMVKTAKDDSARMMAAYPLPMSMQLVQLYNNKQSMYYFVADSQREYKEFNFGAFINKGQYDFQGVQVADKVSLSCSRYPFVSYGQSKTMTTIAGVSDHGDWYDGSNKYRAFLQQAGMTRQANALTAEWTGFSVLIGTQYGDKQFASYTQAEGFKDTYTNWAERTNRYGVTSTTLIGWHKGGFDAMYPDYEFQTGVGFGEEAFASAMKTGHANGNTFLAYINAHIADKNSKWSNTVYHPSNGVTNMEQAAIKTKGFSSAATKEDYIDYMISESYGTGTYYYAMCPDSAEFRKAIVDAVERLRNNGIDGIWFDQLMEMPANLCFDASHGHQTPATAYGEGYKQMFAEIEKAMAKKSGDYIFAAEGVCDAYVEYVDVCGYMWGRKLGARDTDGKNMSPELTRFTIPAKFLGIEGAGTNSGDADEFARAFVMSDPFLADPYKPSVGTLTSIYAQDSTYLTGRYVDMEGASCTAENIIFGLTVSNDNKKIVLSAYNYDSEKALGAKVTIDLARLGLGDKKIVSAVEMFSGDKISYNGSEILLPDMDELGITSILIELK